MITPFFRFMVVLLLGVGLAAPLLAQTTDQGKKRAKAHFLKGEELFEQGRFAEAAREFTQANKLAPHPRVLFNIATCHEKSGDIPAAVLTYRKYLSEAEDTDEYTQIKASLKKLEAMVGEVRVGCGLSPCEIIVDGTSAGNAPLSVVLSPGQHSLAATYNGQMVDETKVHVKAGKQTSTTLALNVETPVATPTPPSDEDDSPDSAFPPDTQPEIEDDSGEKQAKLGAPFWVLAGVTVASGAVTTVFGIRTLQTKDDFVSSNRIDEKLKEEGERDRLITNIMGGVTAAAGIAALSIAIYNLSSSKKKEKAIAVGPGPFLGLAVTGEF